MDSNNSQRYYNKNDIRIVHINNKLAEKYEINREYKESIRLYESNIKRYNDSFSKVKLAQLYLEGKTSKIDNEKARNLLEQAYNQGDKRARHLLAYTLVNGIGGKKEKDRAFLMIIDELKQNNPDPMIYIELRKLISKRKNIKKTKKSLKRCITFSEKIQYFRKVRIDKFNNTYLGKLVNKIPNKISTKLDFFIQRNNNKRISYNLQKLYEKAERFHNKCDFETSRKIYKRLANYGDFDSKIKYAKMCSEGIGGKQDISTSRNIYENILDNRSRKLRKINSKIDEIENKLVLLDLEKKSRKNSKLERQYNKEKESLLEKRNCILKNSKYAEVYLNYGILLSNNFSNNLELEKGIKILKYFAKRGDRNSKQKNAKQYDQKARIAIKKLGELYESGNWKPENIDEEKSLFNKFVTSKINGYTSYIVDKMNGKNIQLLKSNKKIKNKKCKIRYELGTLCEFLNIKFLARKLYESMYNSGDSRGAYSLAVFEHIGKGGEKNLDKAKKHYRAYINSTVDTEERIEKLQRFNAVNNLGNIYEEQDDLISAIELYKIAAKNGNKYSKASLKELYKKGIWNPNELFEYDFIKPKLIEKIAGKINAKKLKHIENRKNRKIIPNIDFRKPVAVGMAAITGAILNSEIPKFTDAILEKDNNNIEIINQKFDYNYTVGDEVSIFNENTIENSKIVGIVAYNQNTKEIIDKENNYNFENYGLSSERYIEKLAKEKSINKNSINLLYCLKNDTSTKIVNPIKEEMFISKLYNEPQKDNSNQAVLEL